MVNYVWQKDYQGLYDYDSREVIRECYSVKTSSLVLYGKERKILKEVSQSDYREEVEWSRCRYSRMQPSK